MPRTVHRTWTGLDPALLKSARRGGVSPIIAKSDHKKLEPIVLGFPGCDFEVMIANEIIAGFRHGDFKALNTGFVGSVMVTSPAAEKYLQDIGESEVEIMNYAEFYESFVDHLIIALKNVTGGPDVVAESAHFRHVIGNGIRDLDGIGKKGYRKLESVKKAVLGVKEKLFTALMSRDLRNE